MGYKHVSARLFMLSVMMYFPRYMTDFDEEIILFSSLYFTKSFVLSFEYISIKVFFFFFFALAFLYYHDVLPTVCS